jgi:hypothetical protein
MSDQDIGLLDVVPWTHGYAHSWALRWMVANSEPARAAVLSVFLPDGRGPWRVKQIDREYRVGRHRADLRAVVTDIRGRETTVLIETKVNDDLSDHQLRAYCGEPAEVVIYAPGLTGLLLAANDCVARERWVTGRQVTAALAGVSLPDLVRSYLTEVAVQADRMGAARAAARGDASDFPVRRASAE